MVIECPGGSDAILINWKWAPQPRLYRSRGAAYVLSSSNAFEPAGWRSSEHSGQEFEKASHMSARETSERSMTLSSTEASRALEGLLSDRYSCRAFLDRPVDRGVIEEILRLAQKTASWCNSQPWELIVASKPATDRLRECFYRHATRNPVNSDFDFPGEYVGVYKRRRRACAEQLYAAVGIEFGDRAASAKQAAENFRFFGAPHFALVTTDRNLGVYGAIDCGAYVSSFMLAAHSLGVASIAQAALATQSAYFHEILEIPEDRMIVCGLSFGYADPAQAVNQFRTARAPLSEAARWLEG
jgi:nitroreductase